MQIQNESLRTWIELHKLKAELFEQDRIIKLSTGTFILVEPKKFYDEILSKEGERVLGDEMSLILSDKEVQLINKYEVDYFLIYFGSRYYYFDDSDLKTKNVLDRRGEVEDVIYYVQGWKEFKCVGEPSLQFEGVEIAYLGIHGPFDLCNGSRNYKDWCKKAKWLGIKVLGLCEENTLAGTLEFQTTCQKAEIKSIIGETISVKPPKGVDYQIKLYCKNDAGWRNLLSISATINTRSERNIPEENLFKFTEGLICILTPTINLSKIYNTFRNKFENLYYQLDLSEWSSDMKDEDWLNNLTTYLTNYVDLIEPILLYDSYYLDKEDHTIQKLLWKIGKRQPGNQSADKYFKSVDDILEQAVPLFSTDKGNDVLLQALENTNVVAGLVDFTIPTGAKHLPQYELTPEEKIQYGDNETLFWSLIEKGLQERVIAKGLDPEPYMERVAEEVRVIDLGHLKDYFLIVWDILNWARAQGIYLGLGRGSSAGCMVSYLLYIVQVDPLEYDLLFERFLDVERVTGSLPDIDNDIQSTRREEVKRYMEERYGVDYVASIGTYGTFKIRAAIKDILREIGGDAKEANYVSAIIEGEDSFNDLFKKALEPTVNKRLKKFVQKHALQIDQIPLLFGQQKNASIHAAGVIIVPKGGGRIQRQLPMKKIDGIMVSEWEGTLIDEAGFLKVDILGIRQLDKFADIITLIDQHRGVKIKFEEMRLDEPEVYRFFQKGFNEDIFQFGGAGLKSYCKELLPETIDDLIATVALYRPGPIEIGAHIKYARIKNGLDELDYDYGLEEITKSTYSTIVYQEQIMKIIQHLGGLSLVEANGVRKAMGKKLIEVMIKYKELFIEGAVKNLCPRLTAENIWYKMEGFAGYAFNKSHATCYAITGYYSQWLKVKYPLEFWLVSLKYTDQKDMQARISEIKAIGSGIDITGPDVLKSRKEYFGHIETNKIYWALNSISYVSEAATEEIMKLRDVDKRFFADFEDFYNLIQTVKVEKKGALQEGERMRSPINKRVLTNLIIVGAFDELEKIGPTTLWKRGELLKKLYELSFPELKLEPFSFHSEKWKKRMTEELMVITDYKFDYQWIMAQKKLCGFGDLNFKELMSKVGLAAKADKFRTNNEINATELKYDRNEKLIEQDVVVGGVVQSIIERKSKNGPFAQLLLHDGEKELYITVWNEIYDQFKTEIDNGGNKILFIDGITTFDKFKNSNVIHSKSYSIVKILN